jgi:hypothetical protein
MNRIFILMTLICMIMPAMVMGQAVMLNSNQSLPLVASAGDDVTIITGNSTILGSDPSAANGYGSYLYLWSPAVGLDDPTKANPVASPIITTTYILTVTDFQNCSVQDEVTVTVKSSGIEFSTDVIDFKVYPNPTDGNLILDIKGVPGSLILKIINSTGNIVHQVNRDTGPVFREELDTRIFAKGNYFVMLIHKGKVLTRSIIIN